MRYGLEKECLIYFRIFPGAMEGEQWTIYKHCVRHDIHRHTVKSAGIVNVHGGISV